MYGDLTESREHEKLVGGAVSNELCVAVSYYSYYLV